MIKNCLVCPMPSGGDTSILAGTVALSAGHGHLALLSLQHCFTELADAAAVLSEIRASPFRKHRPRRVIIPLVLYSFSALS